MQDIQSWISESLLDATVNEKIVTVNGVGNFLIVDEKLYISEGERTTEVTPSYFDSFQGTKTERLFDDRFQLILNQEEIDLVSDESIDVKYFLFQFGERWYYCDDYENPTLTEFKYLGAARKELDMDFPFLGVHGGYDLCNGSRLYKDWCKKAKFLGIKTLGICEDNTLAGTLDFQAACKEAGIKSIIGETITVKGERTYQLKVYCMNEVGWKNLLRINAEINVHNNGFITEERLSELATGLVCIVPPDSYQYLKDYIDKFDAALYQLDLSEWDNQERDKKWCDLVKNYLDDYPNCALPHVLISDAYYLDKSDAPIRRLLNKIGDVKFKYNSKNQWFKSLDEVFAEQSELFSDEDGRLFDVIETGVANLNTVFAEVDFKIEVGKPKLPRYEMTPEENEKYSGDANAMILDLINQGFAKKIEGKVEDEKIYRDRIDYELDLLIKGDIVNYFLILADILNWCRKEDIWIGIGRGSAAGSAVAYCTGLTNVDPIKFDLMFERFISPARILAGAGICDIDSDVESSRRDDVKRYIEERYGVDYVASIGTYSTMKLRGAIGDLARCASVPATKTKFVTACIDPESSFSQLFSIHAKENSAVRDYVKTYPTIIDNLPSCLNQPKTSSVHAAGVVIVPKEYGTIYEQIPVKKMNGLLISEWEGEFIDKAGYLKCDILGIKQLDKFSAISRAIKKNTDVKITFDDIELEDEAVYDLFKLGHNIDVFQFGTSGLMGYCKKLKPEFIEDLVSAVALYRPGAMETGGHEKYIRVKNGVEQPFYWFGCEELTKNTHGIIVFQEQVMKIVQAVGGLSPSDSEFVRKAMGKKQADIIMTFKEQFINGAIEKGCDEDQAKALWDAMESFASYAFNKSHAACYAITGYYSQWFKSNYPLEFYTVALQFADKKEEKLELVAEINKAFPFLKISPPDINNSTFNFTPNPENNTIYWSMTVKYAGEAAISDIQTERVEGGKFFSLEEFVERTDKYRSINIRVIKNLILSGSFDEIERITDVRERYRLLEWHYANRKTEFTEDIVGCKEWKEHKWTMLQISLSGCGFINFEKIIAGSKVFASKQDKYKSITDLLNEDILDVDCVTSGVLVDVIERNSRNGKFCQLEIQDNSDSIYITLWNEVYEPIRAFAKDRIGTIVILSGKLMFDSYKNKNSIQSNRTTKIEFV